MAGGETIGFNNSIFLAEREHADRNFALAYQLKEYGCFPEGTNIKDCLDLWYQCCSMEVILRTMINITSSSVLRSPVRQCQWLVQLWPMEEQLQSPETVFSNRKLCGTSCLCFILAASMNHPDILLSNSGSQARLVSLAPWWWFFLMCWVFVSGLLLLIDMETHARDNTSWRQWKRLSHFMIMKVTNHYDNYLHQWPIRRQY